VVGHYRGARSLVVAAGDVKRRERHRILAGRGIRVAIEIKSIVVTKTGAVWVSDVAGNYGHIRSFGKNLFGNVILAGALFARNSPHGPGGGGGWAGGGG